MSHNNMPREKGTAWERRGVDLAREHGLPWERAPLRATGDLLDVEGCLPDGWLVGFKALGRTANLADRMSDAMRQAQAARERLGEYGRDHVVPVQILQRQGYPTGRAYAVMEYDDFLSLVVERRKWRANR